MNKRLRQLSFFSLACLWSFTIACGNKEKAADDSPTEQPKETAVETTETPAEEPVSAEPVDPSTLPIDERRAICNEAIRAGNCEAKMARWAYDPEKIECEQFTYGGCGGTRNNFRTQEACVNTCSGIQ